jgi:hypothetical protein
MRFRPYFAHLRQSLQGVCPTRPEPGRGNPGSTEVARGLRREWIAADHRAQSVSQNSHQKGLS